MNEISRIAASITEDTQYFAGMNRDVVILEDLMLSEDVEHEFFNEIISGPNDPAAYAILIDWLQDNGVADKLPAVINMLSKSSIYVDASRRMEKGQVDQHEIIDFFRRISRLYYRALKQLGAEAVTRSTDHDYNDERYRKIRQDHMHRSMVSSRVVVGQTQFNVHYDGRNVKIDGGQPNTAIEIAAFAVVTLFQVVYSRYVVIAHQLSGAPMLADHEAE